MWKCVSRNGCGMMYLGRDVEVCVYEWVWNVVSR